LFFLYNNTVAMTKAETESISCIYREYINLKKTDKGIRKMNIGINWDAYGHGELTNAEQIEQIKSAGFTNIFILAEDEELDSVVSSANKSGLTVDTLHAPFGGINYMWHDSENGECMLNRLIKSVDACKRNGVPILIVHLSSGDNSPHVNDIGGERFKKLMDYADANEVLIAFENQRKIANIAYAFERYSNAKFCWDIGHEECFADGKRFMNLFGEKVCALHIHDNYRIHEGDCHMIPFDATVDFDRVARTLAEYNYEGTVMLEIFRHIMPCYADVSAEEYYTRAAKAACRIRDMVTEYKNQK